MKDMYVELIQMIMAREEEVWSRGTEETKELHMLKNYQDLTNRQVH